MNLQCPKCLWIHQLDRDDRPPPWCKKCGIDLKPHEFLPADDAPQAVAEPEEITQVTGSPRPWLDQPKPEDDTHAPLPLATTDPVHDGEYGLPKTCGIILIVVAGLWAGNVWTFAKSAGRAEGRVVISNDYFDPLKNHGRPTTEPISVVRYDVQGKTHEFPAPELAEGTTVLVLYPTDEPAQGRLSDPVRLYRWPLLLAMIGCGIFGWATAATRALTRAQRNAP